MRDGVIIIVIVINVSRGANIEETTLLNALDSAKVRHIPMSVARRISVQNW